jgi:hypothetical protein
VFADARVVVAKLGDEGLELWDGGGAKDGGEEEEKESRQEWGEPAVLRTAAK